VVYISRLCDWRRNHPNAESDIDAGSITVYRLVGGWRFGYSLVGLNPRDDTMLVAPCSSRVRAT
jgi:hypothetical protein